MKNLILIFTLCIVAFQGFAQQYHVEDKYAKLKELGVAEVTFTVFEYFYETDKKGKKGAKRSRKIDRTQEQVISNDLTGAVKNTFDIKSVDPRRLMFMPMQIKAEAEGTDIVNIGLWTIFICGIIYVVYMFIGGVKNVHEDKKE